MGTTPTSATTVSDKSGNDGNLSEVAGSALVPQTGTDGHDKGGNNGQFSSDNSKSAATSSSIYSGGWKDLVFEAHRSQGLNNDCICTIINSLRESTRKQYTVYIDKFLSFSKFQNLSTFHPVEVDVINFLQSLYDSGLSYSVINTASSAIKTFLELINYPITFTSRFVRFKKGCFNLRPTLPRYVATWDPQIVLNYFDRPSRELSLYELTCKCVTLLALASYQRVSTLHAIRFSDLKLTCDKAVISFSSLHKQSRPGKHLTGLEFDSFPNSNVCVVNALKAYVDATSLIRTEHTLSSFFVTCVKPYRAASKDTIARWIKVSIHKAGVPDTFSAHSTRSASTSADAARGVDEVSILKKAGWSSSCTFYRFYNKPIQHYYSGLFLVLDLRPFH